MWHAFLVEVNVHKEMVFALNGKRDVPLNKRRPGLTDETLIFLIPPRLEHFHL